MAMLLLRDLPKYEAISARAERYPEIDPRGLEAFLVLLRVGSDVLAAFEKYLSSHKMSQGSFTVMMVLHRDGPGTGMNPSELAKKCGVTRATMTGLLDGLEKKKLIRRESEQEDRRTIIIRLTEGASKHLDGMLHDYYKRISQLMGELSEEDKKWFVDTLLKVNKGIPHVTAGVHASK